MKFLETRAIALENEFGLDAMLSLTLTFTFPVYEIKEANDRWRSVRTNLVNERYPAWLRFLERKSGALHFHVLLCMSESFIGRLHEERQFWWTHAPLYGFGIIELKPVRTPTGLVRYLRKYLFHREAKDKWARLASCSQSVSRILATHRARFYGKKPMPAILTFL